MYTYMKVKMTIVLSGYADFQDAASEVNPAGPPSVAVWQCITVYYGVTRPAHSTCVLSGYSSATELIVYHSTCELWCVPNSTKPITCISVTL